MTPASAEAAFSSYKSVLERGATIAGSTALATYLVPVDAAVIAVSDVNAGRMVGYLDPADYAAAPRTVKYRLSANLLVNATAPVSTFAFGLYPVTAVAGASGTVSVTLGTVIAGSVATFTSPSGSTLTAANSGDFTAPAAGHYAIGLVVSAGIPAAASRCTSRVILQARQV